MNTPQIIVSYKGGEKRVGLSVQPSLELSDSQVERAESELHRSLQRLFSVDLGVGFYLHEVETGRVMSKESFREPSYCLSFPAHWYMVVDTSAGLLENSGYQNTNGSVAHHMTDLSRLGEDMSSLDLEESGLPTLTALSHTDSKYQSFTLQGTGDSGCVLRYFSIQPSTSLRGDTPVDHSDSRSHSRSDSYVSSASADSLDALKLSTMFVGQVREGSVAARAGMGQGFVVHMVDKDSVLRCNVEQIKVLVEQCTNEVTLLGLPQDSDDLQFLYSKYTNGESGQFSTDDGFITVVDIPLILGPTSSALSTTNGLSPPVGMVPFDPHSDSQENSLSYDQYPLSTNKHSAGDDILIMGSLSEIGTHDIAKWDGGDPLPTVSKLEESSRDARHSGLTGSREWYQHDDEYTPPPEGGQGSLSGSTQDPSSQASSHTPQSDRKPHKSLETLTKIGCSLDQETEQVDVDQVIGGNKWRSQSFNSSHGCPSSENSQHSGGSVRGQSAAQLEEHMSGESAGSGNQESALARSTSSCSATRVPKASGGRPAGRGYQAKRKELHRARSKNTVSDSELPQSWNEGEVELSKSANIGSHYGNSTNRDATPRHHGNSTTAPYQDGLEPYRVGAQSPVRNQAPIPMIRHGSVKEQGIDATTPPTWNQKPRPMSAVEPHSVNSLLVPNSSRTYNFKPTEEVPLFNIITALSPSGEEESYREVNIGEAIERSQGNTLSCQGTNTGDSLDVEPSSRKPLLRHKSLDSGSALNTGLSGSSGSFLANSIPSTGNRMEIVCHGLLSIKQDVSALGKKAQDRSWRHYYAVLAGTRIVFYRDKRDAVLKKPSEEPPLEVVPATVDLETKNTKRKFVFRLMTRLGQSYLLQADDAPNRQRWMELIQKQNLHCPNTWQNKLQLSPNSVRRLSSPQPLQSSGKTGGGGQGGKFLGKIKALIRPQRDAETDYSSFVAFGQPLQDCPVSPDNKRVPLVVEYCVGEVEEHGLTVEGIYRKPGLVAMINNMSAQMDKGNYKIDISDYGQDIHTAASLLKKFLKELPDPLLPSAMYNQFVACAKLTDEERLTTLKDLVLHLPTAHYHTLRFLMQHLEKVVAHSAENKMTLRNVALVFGPTLMGKGEDLLASMAASHTVVELLCKHHEYLCGDELCAEELTEQDKPVTEQEDSMSPQAEKRKALASASPLSVRRIKNKISTSDKDIALKRHSSAYPETFGSIPKLENHTGTATLGYLDSNRAVLHASDSNINSSPVPEGEGPGGRKRVVRHDYEDMEIAQRDDSSNSRNKSNSRTVNWINHHTEMNWGRGGEEVTGSMWSSRNRMPRSHSKEKFRNNGGAHARRMVKTKSDQGRDALSTFQAAASRQAYRQPPMDRDKRPLSRGLDDVGQPPLDRGQPQGQEDSRGYEQSDDAGQSRGQRRGMDSKERGQNTTLKTRRTSYMVAMNEPTELPVRDISSPITAQDTPYGAHVPYTASSRHGNSRGYGAAPGQVYSHSTAHPTLLQQRVSKYSTLQHDTTTPINQAPSHHRRRSSESADPSLEPGRQQYFQPRAHMQGQRPMVSPYRTFSNENPYSTHNTPPQRGDRHSKQVESYL